ncbi:MAG: hypothetical protein J2P23_06525 [Microlunatus sp.]|nr:hypothetical protein [Microlunatus sp.]
MTATSSVEFPLPARPFSYAELELMPDDGRRYEIIDADPDVSPSPVTVHQRASSNLLGSLRAAAPPFEVFGAPFDVVPADGRFGDPRLLTGGKVVDADRPCAVTFEVTELIKPARRP